MPAVPGALEPKDKSTFQVLEVAKREYCFVMDTCFKELQIQQELKAGSDLRQNVSLGLAEHL